MRLPLWLKLSFIVSIIFIVALAAILQSTNAIFYQDKRNFLVEMSSKINSSVSSVFNERIINTKKKLAIFTSNYESLSDSKKKHPDLDKVIFSQYPEFLAIGLMGGDKNIQWLRVNPESSVKAWPKEFTNRRIVSSNQDFEDNEKSVSIQPFLGPNDNNYFLFQFPVKIGENKGQAKVVAIMNQDLFANLLNDYKASLNRVFVTNEKGEVMAHPFTSSIGQNLQNHSVVKEVVQGRQKGVGDNYSNLEGDKVVASFQSIPGTNLFTYTTTPKKEAFSAANELWRNLLVIAAGVLLIGIVISILFTRIITNPLKRLKETARKIGSGKFNVDIDVKSKDEVGDLAGSIRMMAKNLIERDEALENSKKALVQSEKMSAFGQLSAGIAHEVKNPLAGILGHAQLARNKIKDGEALKHVNFIEKETRRTKDIIENLMKFSRAEKLELTPTNLYDTVHGAVDLVDHQLSLQGVKIFTHINRVSPVLGHSNQIQQVLLNLMMNAGHAMEDSEKKELHVYLEDKPEKDSVQIRLEDSGKGMPKEVKDRIFEPFYTTKPAGKGTGLGLSVSVGIIKDHNGEISVESEIDQGTTFFIDIPINHEVELPESNRAEGSIASDEVQDVVDRTKKEIEEEKDLSGAEENKGDPSEVREGSGEQVAKNKDVEFPEPPEGSDLVEEEPTLHSSRDYLMSEEEVKKLLGKKTNLKRNEHTKVSESSFKVKIRKPKTGQS